MKILSFDTSNNLASVAIRVDGELVAYHITKENSQQAEKLFSLIRLCLSEAKLQLADIDLISVTNGPGSFTGVRIGLAAASGMQVGSKCKFIALTNFQVLAWQALQENPGREIAIILNARREQVYLQTFNERLEELEKASLVNIEDLELPKNMTLIGDGVSLLPELNVPKNLQIKADARMLSEASEFYWKNKNFQDLEPLYIREPDVSKKKTEEK